MIQPGTKVTITIEATVMQAFDGGAVHVAYGADSECTLAIRPGTPGVAIMTGQPA
jgi:hypothetical protein